MKPKVSIIIPSFNHAAFVGQALQSILDQSFQDFEIIVTDDGSMDGSVDVIRSFSDSRINLEVFEKNRGAVFALNSAIRRSQGEFLCYLSSDDYFLPNKLEKQVEYLEHNPNIAAVFGLPQLIDERGRPFDQGYREFRYPFPDIKPTHQHWLRHFFFAGNCLCHSTAMIRRSVFDSVGLFDPRYFNLPDFDMWVRLCMAHEIHVMQEELTGFRLRDNLRNVSAQRSDTVLRGGFENLQILKQYRQMPPELVREVFSTTIISNGIDTARPSGAWLAELALLSGSRILWFFALDTLHEISATADTEIRHLNDLAGKIDVFNIGMDIFMNRIKMTDSKLYNELIVAMRR